MDDYTQLVLQLTQRQKRPIFSIKGECQDISLDQQRCKVIEN